MSYSSINFMVFLLITLVLFYLVPKKFQWLILLLASICFYGISNYIFGILLFTTVLTTWGAALLIHKYNLGNKVTERSIQSVIVYTAVIAINIAIMIYFKISGAIVIGLSFYTFQTIGYLTDVFRYAIQPQKNPAKYFLFASFFPQILSGPIGRYDQLSPQFFREKKYNADAISMGAQRIIWGLFKKMVFADRIAVIVNEIFNNYSEYKGVYVAIAAMFFIIQLYADFSGLIDIASGVAQMFQIELAINFNTPLFARSISDFWTRWHISLSSWFKDYLFYPLIKSRVFLGFKDLLIKIFGKKRAKNISTYTGLFILWLAIGCWHGLQGHFIVGAGLIFWFFIVIGKILSPVFEAITKLLRINKKHFIYKLFEVIRTFILLSLAMIFWRADNLEVAFKMLRGFSIHFNGNFLNLGLDMNNIIVMGVALVILFVVDIIHYKKIEIRKNLIEKSIFIKWPIYIMAIMAILLFGMYGPEYNASDFIYFKF